MKNNLAITIYLFAFLQNTAQTDKVDYSYPPLVMGSSWGNVFQRFFKLGDFDSMIKLTSDSSLNEYGEDSIRKFYANMDFGYQLKLKSWTENKCCYTLNYDAMIDATHVIIRMILLKGDPCKIVLPVDFKKQTYFLYK